MLNKSVSTPKPNVYPPLNRCAYCGDQKGPFSREHILPIGLGGGLILPKASCESCRKVTHDVETTCLRKMFLPYRMIAGWVRHKDDLPSHMPLLFSAGKQKAGRRIRVERHPPILVLPHFLEPPGILLGHAPTSQIKMIYQVIGDHKLHDKMQPAIANQTRVSLHFDIGAFMRMLAKIAHAFAVAEIGLDDFDPALPDLIFNRDLSLASYLIGLSTNELPINEHLLHQVAWGGNRWGSQWLAGVRIRLFAAHPTSQAYTVIAGVLSPRAVARYATAQLSPSP